MQLLRDHRGERILGKVFRYKIKLLNDLWGVGKGFQVQNKLLSDL